MIYYYVFRINTDNSRTYLRTCGTEQAAKEWVALLETRGVTAVYSVDTLLGGFYY